MTTAQQRSVLQYYIAIVLAPVLAVLAQHDHDVNKKQQRYNTTHSFNYSGEGEASGPSVSKQWRCLITMYSHMSNQELLEIDPYQLVAEDLLGNLEMYIEELVSRFPSTMRAMRTGNLQDDSDLSPEMERLYAFVSSADDSLFKVTSEEMDKAAEDLVEREEAEQDRNDDLPQGG